MCNTLWISIFAFAIGSWTLATSAENCDNNFCNNEGICSVEDDGKKCRCISNQHFTGKFCTEIVNNCQANACTNNAPCTSVLGGFFCHPCPDGYAGMRCSIKQTDFFTQFYVHYNRLVTYGKEQKILLTVSTLGTKGFYVDMRTDNYQIVAFKTFSQDLGYAKKFLWRKSSNLQEVAHNLGLLHTEQMPYKSGYYHVGEATFWTVGDVDMFLVIVDDETSSELLTDWKYSIHILLPSGIDCVPSIRFYHGYDPNELLHVDITRFNIFEPKLEKKCGGVHSVVRFHWGIYTVLGTQCFRNYGWQDGRTLLKIRPYSLWFNEHREALQVYLLQIKVEEHLSSGSIRRTVGRCYVFVDSKPVLAKITGGEKREVNVGKSVIMDGTKSRDYARKPSAWQRMKFKWTCTNPTDLKKNKYCNEIKMSENKFTIPANTLHVGQSYTYNLTVNSLINLYSVNTAQQVITAVPADRKLLQIGINCVRFCRRDKYVPGQLLHLQANCPSCTKKKNISYSWSIDDGGSAMNKERFTQIVPMSQAETMTVKLEIKNGEAVGKASVLLKRNAAPSKGKCSITPTSGKAYETEFKIVCSDIEHSDDDVTLTYQYMADKYTLDRTTDPMTTVHLPQFASLKVIVCDLFLACTDYPLSVSIEPFPTKHTESVIALTQFLGEDGINFANLLDSSASEQCLLLIYSLAKNIDVGDDSLSVVEYLEKQIEGVQLKFLLNIERWADIVTTLFEKLKPFDYKRADVLSKYIIKLNKGLDIVLNDNEARELLATNYKILAEYLMEIFNGLTTKLDDIVEPQIRTLPLLRKPKHMLREYYPNMPEFDSNVVQRINSWLQLTWQLQKWLDRLGMAAAWLHEPTEPHLDIKLSHVQLQMFAIEGYERMQFTFGQGLIVIFNSQTLRELQKSLKSPQLLLQVVTFDKDANPMWWYPNDCSLSTDVLFLSVFKRLSSLQGKDQMKVHPPIEIRFPIKLISTRVAEDPEDIHDELIDYWDMPMYYVELRPNTLLIVYFKQATAAIRIGLQTEKKPRSFEVRKSDLIILNFVEPVAYTIFNDKDYKTTAYIAVLAAINHPTAKPYCYFSFSTEIRECLAYQFDAVEPEWYTTACHPAINYSIIDNTHLRCFCTHLTPFAGKVIKSDTGAVHWERRLLSFIPLNWKSLLWFVVLIVGIILIFMKAHWDSVRRCDVLKVALTKDDLWKEFDVHMIITTGIFFNAGTTANLKLTFSTMTKREVFREFTIYQHPEHPCLTKNSRSIVKLPFSTDEIGIPFRCEIQHDNAGRYPSWYCESLLIKDLKFDKKQLFVMNRWVRTEDIISIIVDFHEETELESPNISKWRKHYDDFKVNATSLFQQWYFCQPVWGDWQYHTNSSIIPSIDRFARTSIWITRLSVMICIIMCYFGPTTLENYEEERELYKHLIINSHDLIGLCIVTYIAGLLVQYALIWLWLQVDNSSF